MSFNGMIEINNARKDAEYSTNKINQKSPLVEIFSHMSAGKNVSELNGKLHDSEGKVVNSVDEGVAYIRELARQAGGGNGYAVTELNELRTFTIWPLLQEELKLLSWMGNYTALGYNESILAKTSKLVGDKSRFQALSGDVVFPIWDYDSYPVSPISISGGYQVDYRKIQLGDMSDENIGMEQVRVDIRNKAAQYVIWKIYNSLQTATGVKFISATATVTKTALDDMIRNIRRFGSVGISGDYAVVSQINGFAGYQGVNPNVLGISEAAMEEIRKTGLLGMYSGCIVKEISNGFDMTKPLPANNGWRTLFPEGLLFVIPNGKESPVRSWTRGGLTSFTGNSVETGRVLTRFDLEVACDVEKGSEYKIGLIHDTMYSLVDPMA